MKYVDMQDVAFDQQNIVFPGLGNCHGVVYVNDQGMFGYHLSGIPKQNRLDAFGDFVRRHPSGGGAGKALYGFCPTNRFVRGQQEHRDELRQIAAALGFTGRILGYRWDQGQVGTGTTYVDVSFNRGAIMSSYESYRDEKQTGRNEAKPDHKSVLLGNGAPAQPIEKDEVIDFALRSGTPTFFHATAL